MSIQIESAAKQAKGKDTLMLLKIGEQGRITSTAEMIGNYYHIDSAVNIHFLDTAIISGDSIFKLIGYHCKVFPFWKSHYIVSDSLKKVRSEADTFLALSDSSATNTSYTIIGPDTLFGTTSSSSFSICVLQNIGLYSLHLNYSKSQNSLYTSTDTNITLISFNNKPIPVETKLPQKNIRVEKRTLNSKNFKTLMMMKGAKLTSATYLLNGKKNIATGNIPSGIAITEGANPAKKNK